MNDNEAAKWIPSTRQELAYLIPNGGVAAELGVAKGLFSKQLLNANPNFRLVCIDAWDDPVRRHDADEMLLAANRLLPYGHRRVTLLRSRFDKAAEMFADGMFDLVYVDGYAHTGQEDGQTLTQWWPKVKTGGIFAGHDYHPRWQATVDAVNRFVREVGRPLNLTTQDDFPSWWIEK